MPLEGFPPDLRTTVPGEHAHWGAQPVLSIAVRRVGRRAESSGPAHMRKGLPHF